MLKILLGIIQINAMVLQKAVNLNSRLESQKTSDLLFRQPTRPVALERKALRRRAAYILAPSNQRICDIFRYIDFDLHIPTPLWSTRRAVIRVGVWRRVSPAAYSAAALKAVGDRSYRGRPVVGGAGFNPASCGMFIELLSPQACRFFRIQSA
jgi:hypothetical protein